MSVNALPLIRNRKHDLILLFVLAILVILFRLPSLDEPFDRDSGANAYGARLIVRGQPLYTSYHPGHHLPAIYYVYALAFSLFGDRLFAVKFFLVLWTIPTAYLFYRLSRHYTDANGSWLAVILFLLLTSERWLKGTTAEIELFANLPRIGATLCLLTLLERNVPSWQFIFIGLIGAVSVLFKAVYISPLALAGVILLLHFWPQRRVRGALACLVKRLGWIGAGFVAGLLPVIVYFGLLGLLPRLALVYTLGQGHVSDASATGPIFLFLYPIMVLGIGNLPILVMGLTGALLMLRDQSMPGWKRAIIPLWLLLSVVEAGFSRKPFPHYGLLVVPPLSLLAAWWLIRLYHVGTARLAAAIISVLLLLSVGIAYIHHNGGYLYHYFRYKTGRGAYQDFVLRAPYGYTLVALQEVADYVRTHSSPEDRIYIWSNDVQLYYLADRQCALDFIWPIYVISPKVPGGPEGMRRRLLSTSTRFVVVAEDDPPTWLAQELAKNYRLTKIVEGWEIHQRADSVSTRQHDRFVEYRFQTRRKNGWPSGRSWFGRFTVSPAQEVSIGSKRGL